MALKIVNAKKVQLKSRQCQVTWLGEAEYKVTSPSGNDYLVTLLEDGGLCTCGWSKYRAAHDLRSGCSHVIAAINEAVVRNGAKSVSAWSDEASAERQHRTVFDIGDGVLLTLRRS